MTSPFLTTLQAAAYLGFQSANGVRQCIYRGELVPDAAGPRGSWLFKTATLDAFMQARKEPGPVVLPHGTVVSLAALSAEVGTAQEVIDEQCGPTRASGYCYAIRQVGSDLTKIGKADDPVRRILGIQRMNASPIVLIGLCHGYEMEAQLHVEHATNRRHGEWFRLATNPIQDGAPCPGCSR